MEDKEVGDLWRQHHTYAKLPGYRSYPHDCNTVCSNLIRKLVEERAQLIHSELGHDPLQHQDDPIYSKCWEANISEALDDFGIPEEEWK